MKKLLCGLCIVITANALAQVQIVPAILSGKVTFEDALVNSHTNHLAAVVGRLKTITVTNWVDSPITSVTQMAYTGIQDPNIVTRYEQGIVTEQLVAVFDWKGEQKTVVLETKPVTVLQRSYTIEQRRVYKP